MRIAVLSDVHANLTALDAVLADAGSVDGIWQLGDIVGYGPEPDAVVERLREVGAIGVRGNHDAAACGGSEIEWFNPDARRAMEWTRRAIASGTVEWLAALPDRGREGECELVHGSLREPLWEYVTSDDVAAANLAVLARGARIGFHGHTHVPVAWVEEATVEDAAAGGEAGAGTGGETRGATGIGMEVAGRVRLVRGRAGASLELGGRLALVNPGSVGQPRDGVADASYLIWEPELDRVTWHRVPYDVAAVQRSMRDAGLPPSLAARLAVGL
ncbi:MAG TPA: metallophosphoesterase family protein [Candidatus Limnocylindrales bacterium]|nr:metallophosphoesterase family protein [Candidatus Limnocylindrales bacterium]